MEKSEIRSLILKRRNELSPAACEEKSKRIMECLKQQEEYQNSKLLFLYHSYQKEVITTHLIEEALQEGKQVALPCACVRNGIPTLEFYEITKPNQVIEGYKGIPEPDRENAAVHLMDEIPELMLIPGVAFDVNRNRLGYGMGFYDRYLAKKCRIRTIAVAYACQLVEQLHPSAFDYRPDKLITEEGIFE